MSFFSVTDLQLKNQACPLQGFSGDKQLFQQWVEDFIYKPHQNMRTQFL